MGAKNHIDRYGAEHFISQVSWEEAARAAGFTIERQHQMGGWPQRFLAFSSGGVEVGAFRSPPTTDGEFPRGFLFCSIAQRMKSLCLSLHIKSALQGGIHLQCFLGIYDKGYPVHDARGVELFRLPATTTKITCSAPLYEDSAICLTVTGEPSLE